jgi:hypothetical protein
MLLSRFINLKLRKKYLVGLGILNNLVIIRLGLTYNKAEFDFNLWLKEIIEAVES